MFLVPETCLFNFRVVLKLDEKESNRTNSYDRKYFNQRKMLALYLAIAFITLIR